MEDNNLDELYEDSQSEAELYEHHNIIVDKGQTLIRIDKYLTGRLQNTSRNKIQQAAQAGNILVNGKSVKSNYRVHPKDEISIVLSFPPRDKEVIPENIPLNIVYEDDDLIVVNKEAGMVVHPAYGNFTGTLVNALAYYLDVKNSDDDRIFLVHRIDKDTSGLLLVAKNEEAQTILAGNFFNHKVDRKYTALVWGNVENDEGTIEGNIGRNLKNRLIMDVFPDGDYGKEAITHYRVLKRFYYVTLVECVLETGRTHQIRAHMKYLGHPLFNDERYGGDKILKGTTFSKYRQFVQNSFNICPRQALHATTLAFTHPKTKKQMHFTSDLPQDMTELVDKWDNYTKYNLNNN